MSDLAVASFQHDRPSELAVAQIVCAFAQQRAAKRVRDRQRALDRSRRNTNTDQYGPSVRQGTRAQRRIHQVRPGLRRPRLGRAVGRVGSCADNAAMESFFSLLQKNVLNSQRWASRDELRLAIITWTEKTYHRRRDLGALGRLTPIEHETRQTSHQAA